MILELDQGATAWVLTSAALVLVMTPGVAFFYGGMVRAKGVLNMMMMSFIAMGTVGVLWALFGFSMSFGTDIGGIIGNPTEYAGLTTLITETGMDGDAGMAYPKLAFVAFQAGFAIITVALISGAIADRVKFGAWTLFTAIWAVLVYFPVAHWVWGGGWISQLGTMIYGDGYGVVDFAGGTAIHINAGAAALALALVIGPRIGFGTKPMRPHNMTLVMLGAGLLWFGWVGFNAGSAVAANTTASLAWVNTMGAGAAAMVSWLVVEKLRDGHPTSLGAASGVVAGLVAATPASASVSPVGSLIIGAVAGVVSAFAIGLKYRFGYDDSLDVVGVHFVGGVVGTLMIGLFADPRAGGSNGVAGLFYGGGFDQLVRQFLGAAAVGVYAFGVTLVIAWAIKRFFGWRISANSELSGIDQNEHSEIGYDLSPVYYTNRVQRTLVLSKEDLAEDLTGASQ
jgi:Amt family ammonium transporter